MADLYRSLDAKQFLELYKASESDPDMRAALRKLVEQMPANEQSDNAIRESGMRTGRYLGLGIVGVALALIWQGEVGWAVAFAGIDVVAMILNFLPTGVLKSRPTRSGN